MSSRNVSNKMLVIVSNGQAMINVYLPFNILLFVRIFFIVLLINRWVRNIYSLHSTLFNVIFFLALTAQTDVWISWLLLLPERHPTLFLLWWLKSLKSHIYKRRNICIPHPNLISITLILGT